MNEAELFEKIKKYLKWALIALTVVFGVTLLGVVIGYLSMGNWGSI